MTSGGFDRLLRPHLRGMTGYVPIMVPGGQEGDGTRPDGSIVKLDGNENVYGCSPKAAEAVARLTSHHIYPDPEQRRLRDALAEYTGVDAGHVVAGAGSDEIIELLLRLITGPGDNVVTAGPTFGFFNSSAKLVGAEVIDVPRGDDFSIDVDAVLAAVGPETKVVYVANPNNPTGTLTPREDLERLLDVGPLVVVDEAYFEFCGETDRRPRSPTGQPGGAPHVQQMGRTRRAPDRLRPLPVAGRGCADEHEVAVQHQRRRGGRCRRLAG